jgi:hypothetical protein
MHRHPLMCTFIAAALVASVLLVVPASAHSPTKFQACAAYRRHGPPCISGRGAATFTPYSYNVVHLRGRVQPSHTNFRADVLRKSPNGVWRDVDSVGVSDEGRLYWRWRVTEEDVNYDGPYRLRFRLTGHGRSNAVRVYIIYGE